MSNPQISLIIPILRYNGNLRRVLDSVAYQVNGDYEIIAVNCAQEAEVSAVLDQYTALYADRMTCLPLSAAAGLKMRSSSSWTKTAAARLICLRVFLRVRLLLTWRCITCRRRAVCLFPHSACCSLASAA